MKEEKLMPLLILVFGLVVSGVAVHMLLEDPLDLGSLYEGER